jgi:hypothetical protein
MSFRFYADVISRASRAVAAGIFITGLVLIGFGFLIYVLPRFFATLAAVVFFIAGAGCGITAVKIFLVQRNLDKFNSEDSQSYRGTRFCNSSQNGTRKNVHIRIKEDFDV